MWRGGTGRQVPVARLLAADLRALAEAAGIHVDLIPV